MQLTCQLSEAKSLIPIIMKSCDENSPQKSGAILSKSSADVFSPSFHYSERK